MGGEKSKDIGARIPSPHNWAKVSMYPSTEKLEDGDLI